MIDLPNDPEHITVYLVQDDVTVLGAARVPLRACRAIHTEKHEIVGWYIARITCAVIKNGVLVGVLYILPDGQRVTCPVEDIGIRRGSVQIGQLLEVEDVRLIHPLARSIHIRSA